MLFSTVKPGQILKIVVIACAFFVTGNFSNGQTDFESVVRNIEPVGQLCLLGQKCSGGNAAVTQVVATPGVAAAPAFDVAATDQMSCFTCQSTGAARAPITGDTEVWEEKLAKGIDSVLANAITGVGVMPAKGICMTCSDDNLRSLIDYRVSGEQ